jgi:hypothetical protein
MQTNKLVFALVGVLLCATAGYSLNRFILSPEDVVRRNLGNICPQNTVAEDFHVLNTRKWSARKIVVYRVNCRSENVIPVKNRNFLGHQVVVRKGLGWQASGSGDRLEVLPQPPGELVHYGIGLNQKNVGGDRHTVIYGEVLKPKVAAVEATFDNGRTLRDEGKDGILAMVLPEAVEVREIRVLGADGQILQRDSTSSPTIYVDQFFFPFAPSPEDAVRHWEILHPSCSQPYAPEATVLGDFRIVRTIKYSQRVIVFYRQICRNAEKSISQASLYAEEVIHENTVWRHAKVSRSATKISYDASPVEHKGRVWRAAVSILAADYLPEVSPTGLVAYSSLSTTATKDEYANLNYTSIFGRALSSEVVAVEATFSTGQTLRDQVTNGVFGMMLPRAAKICEVRILGANGQVLQRNGLTPLERHGLPLGKQCFEVRT